jgi:hypothetical protein
LFDDGHSADRGRAVAHYGIAEKYMVDISHIPTKKAFCC